jgi:hypothetical protein
MSARRSKTRPHWQEHLLPRKRMCFIEQDVRHRPFFFFSSSLPLRKVDFCFFYSSAATDMDAEQLQQR